MVKKIIFSLIPLILLLLIGEIYYRGKYPSQKKKDKTSQRTIDYEFEVDYFLDGENQYYKWSPGTHSLPDYYSYGSNYTINSLGFRGKEFNVSDKKDKIRIFCVGGSSTFALEVPDEETWTVRLHHYLNQQGNERFEVINGGVPGHDSLKCLNLIRHELSNYKPDIFLVYSGYNDVITVEKKLSKFTQKIHGWLYYRSMLYTCLTEKLGAIVHNAYIPLTVYTFKGNPNYKKNMEEIIRLCKENNIQIIFVRQIFHSLDLFARGNVIEKKIVNYSSNSKFSQHNKLMKDLEELCLKYNLKLMDFRKEFHHAIGGGNVLFFDFVHLTSEGNDLLARLIAEKILVMNF